MAFRDVICCVAFWLALGAGDLAAQDRALSLVPSADWGRDRLEAACIEGRGAGTDLLAVSDRIESCTFLSAFEGAGYQGLFHRARARQSARDWAGAEADFTAALKEEPAAADALFERGRVRLIYLDAPDSAFADFDFASELDPERSAFQLMKAQAAIAVARTGETQQVGAMVATAQTALVRYLELTKDTSDITEQMQRGAAQEVLDRLARNGAKN